MFAVSAWATVLTVAGLAVAARAALALLIGDPPPWYEPTLVACGVAGVGLTAGAFLAIHRAWLAWLLLVAAIGPLVIGVLATRAL